MIPGEAAVAALMEAHGALQGLVDDYLAAVAELDPDADWTPGIPYISHDGDDMLRIVAECHVPARGEYRSVRLALTAADLADPEASIRAAVAARTGREPPDGVEAERRAHVEFLRSLVPDREGSP